tara:strand:+ start:220778 stop:220993 length:216 start_codon:yes stop_codon:yes gene_type:complete
MICSSFIVAADLIKLLFADDEWKVKVWRIHTSLKLPVNADCVKVSASTDEAESATISKNPELNHPLHPNLF